MRSILARVLALLGAVAAVLAFVIPLLVASDPADDGEGGIGLLQAIPAFTEAGGGPREEQAMLASVAVGVYAAVLAIEVVVLLVFAAVPEGRAAGRTLRIVSIVLLLGCGGAALLVVVLSSMWDGRVWWFSPAVTAATLAAILAFAAAWFAPDSRRPARGS